MWKKTQFRAKKTELKYYIYWKKNLCKQEPPRTVFVNTPYTQNIIFKTSPGGIIYGVEAGFLFSIGLFINKHCVCGV